MNTFIFSRYCTGLLRTCSLFLVCVAFLANALPAQSQGGPCDKCPPDSVTAWTGLPPQPWINVGCVTVNILQSDGRYCPWTVCYCYKVSGLVAPLVDIYVCGLGSTGCEPIGNYSQMLAVVTKALIEQDPNNHFPCPPCSGLPPSFVNYAVQFAQCYDQNTQQFCNNSSAYCRYEYRVCCENGVKTVQPMGSQSIGSCPPGCTPICY